MSQLSLGLQPPRIVCRFSCGVASAVATRLVLDESPAEDVHIINAFVADEDDDNRRFLADCERWYGRAITVLRDQKYAASVINVWRKKRFIVSRQGAPCSHATGRGTARHSSATVSGTTPGGGSRSARTRTSSSSATAGRPAHLDFHGQRLPLQRDRSHPNVRPAPDAMPTFSCDKERSDE